MSNPSPLRVAFTHLRRQAAPRDLMDVLDTLRSLEMLSGELDDVEEAFNHHFRMAAAIDPKVTSQFEGLQKARKGLKLAQDALKQVTAILEVYPEDKTAQRAVKDADVMVRRFERHEGEAAKIIRTLSQKQMPPALKKLAASVSTAIKRRLVDAKTLQVLPWQNTKERWISGGYRDRGVTGVEYQVVFRIDAGNFPGGNNRKEMILTESTILDIGPFNDSLRVSRPVETTSREAVAWFMAQLEGWPGVAGEGEATANRAATAKGVARAINSANRGFYDDEEATISSDNRRIEGSHRNDQLPKEGAYDMGEMDYQDLVESVIKKFRQRLDRELAPFKDQIQKIDIYDGEKSWIYTSVTLK